MQQSQQTKARPSIFGKRTRRIAAITFLLGAQIGLCAYAAHLLRDLEGLQFSACGDAAKLETLAALESVAKASLHRSLDASLLADQVCAPRDAGTAADRECLLGFGALESHRQILVEIDNRMASADGAAPSRRSAR